MKKILYRIFILLCVITISYNGIRIVSVLLEQKALNDAIDNDQYTAQEYQNFQEELASKTFYYYHNLTEEQKDAYVTIYCSAYDYDESCKVRITEEDLHMIVDAVVDDNSNLFWLTGGYKYTVYPDYVEIVYEYRFEEKEIKDTLKELEKKVDKIISEMPQFATDFEKELYLHDYICENTVYDKSTIGTTGQSAHGALLDGRTVCEGYARAMQMLLDEVGIRNYLIRGNALGDGGYDAHMWNIVEIDGYNYHLDPTWNDGAFTDDKGYFYFNVPDSYIMKTHKDFSVENTNCMYNTANYYVKMNSYVKNFTGFAGLIDVTAKVLSTGENEVEFVFENSSDYKRAVAEIENDSKFFYYVRNSVNKSGRNLNKNKLTYSTVDEYNYLSINFKEG